MIYAFFRGGLAAMAALLVEIFIATFTSSLPNSASFSSSNQFPTDPGVLLVALSAFIEELILFASLLGFAFPISLPQRALFVGISAGIGFSLFEASVKILFLGSNQSASLAFGIIGGGLLHIVTGILLAFSVFFLKHENRPLSFLLLSSALMIHFLYNIFAAPVLAHII